MRTASLAVVLLILSAAACGRREVAPSPPPPATTAPGPSAPATTVEPDAFSVAPAPDVPHGAPGALQPGTAKDFKSVGADIGVVAPFIRFPLESGPAFANSQIFLAGGFGYKYAEQRGDPVIEYPGPGGEENAPANFDYPWADNFCEVRTWNTFKCVGGRGHRGQDVRPATCETEKYWIVAPERSEVKWIEANTVLLYGLDTGNVYTLLHMDDAKIETRVREAFADKTIKIARGERIAKVSNFYGGPNGTTTHLHFEIVKGGLQNGRNKGGSFVPPYSSLLEAYLDLLAENPDQFAPAPQPTGPDRTACAPRP